MIVIHPQKLHCLTVLHRQMVECFLLLFGGKEQEGVQVRRHLLTGATLESWAAPEWGLCCRPCGRTEALHKFMSYAISQGWELAWVRHSGYYACCPVCGGTGVWRGRGHRNGPCYACLGTGEVLAGTWKSLSFCWRAPLGPLVVGGTLHELRKEFKKWEEEVTLFK